METPNQKRLLPRRSLRRGVLVTLILIGSLFSSGSAAVAYSSGVATTQSYTYFSDVPGWAQPSVAKCLNSGIMTGTGTSPNGTPVLDISADFARAIVLLDRAGYLNGDTEYDESWYEPTPPAPPEVEEEIEGSQEDNRALPIYEVYKNGYRIEVPAETQWIIRDFAAKYGYNEKLIFGLAVIESTFDPNVAGDSGKSIGLYQIQRYWISGANIPRFTDDYRNRDLKDPYDATLTLMEMWEYARTSYGIDINTDQGMKDLFYWHNSGKYKKNVSWSYSNKIFGYAAELITIEY